MRFFLCSICDSVAGQYMPPFLAVTMGTAQRQVQDELRRPDSELAKHPKDYELVFCGFFDNEGGEIVSIPPLERQRVRIDGLVES